MALQLAAVEEAKRVVELELAKQRSKLEDKDAQIAEYRALLGQDAAGL
jgi:hypothetical protein